MFKRIGRFLLIIILIFLLIILLASREKENKIIYEHNTSINVFFCPKDNCYDLIIKLFSSANKSIHCVLYSVSDRIINFLANLSLDVKIVLGKEKPKRNFIINYKRKKGITHDKFCIIDHKLLFTGSLNPTELGLFHENNNLVIIHSKYLARNYEDEFLELLNKKFPGNPTEDKVLYLDGVKIENLFCPEDNCLAKVEKILARANKSIYFATFAFTSGRLANILIEKHYQGINISGVMEKSEVNKYSKYALLRYHGINVTLDKNKYNMHHKFFVIDEKIVITGSMNPSFSGAFYNDENILVIYDKEIAKKFLDEFYSLIEKL